MIHPNPAAQSRFTTAAAQGLRVFPVLAHGKKPGVTWTPYRESAPEAALLASWDASNFNVGVITGASADLLEIDADSRRSQSSARWSRCEMDPMSFPRSTTLASRSRKTPLTRR
ncbi:bifunctional DNA primase/polymerase [Novosphingobium piscinae]|uniref:Bifunctional DNA primase/polymerase n=1 Tax=Novosphingobium piscinae TaxID=1507448 RepID=A0A7X1FWY2_9SPHN|nr:bifunctional DNA primase/polymerase [Novosphingobium piscinae]